MRDKLFLSNQASCNYYKNQTETVVFENRDRKNWKNRQKTENRNRSKKPKLTQH